MSRTPSLLSPRHANTHACYSRSVKSSARVLAHMSQRVLAGKSWRGHMQTDTSVLHVGTRVVLQKLVSRPELNGQEGRILGRDLSTGRYAVDVGGIQMKLKVECIARVTHMSETQVTDLCAACRGPVGDTGLGCGRCATRYCDPECFRTHQAYHQVVCGSTNSTCPVCNRSVSQAVTILSCQHRMCENCVPLWLAHENLWCPLCGPDRETGMFGYQFQGRCASFAIAL